MVILGLLMCRTAAKVILLPKTILRGGCCVGGVWHIQRAKFLFRCADYGGFGRRHVVLERYGFSAGPLVLGIVLGPIAEQNFVLWIHHRYRRRSYRHRGALPYFFGGVMISH